MRRLWIILGSIFTVAVLALGSYSAVNALAREDVEVRDVVVAAEIDEIIVDASNGSIDVVGDPDATEVTIDADIRHGLRRTDYSVSQSGGRLLVDGGCHPFTAFWCRVDVTITAPAHIPLDLHTSNGTIAVSDIEAGVVARTSNGWIDLIGVSGPVNASTSNGSIRGHGLAGADVRAHTSNGPVELTFARPPETVDAKTSNGSVKVTVPDTDDAYAVDVDTSSHSSTEITVRTDPTSDRTIKARTSNGSVSVFYPTS